MADKEPITAEAGREAVARAAMEAPVNEMEHVRELLALLTENGAPGGRELRELASHVYGMERQLAGALEELEAVRRKMQEAQDRSLKNVLRKSYKAVEGNVGALCRRVSELKAQIAEGCGNILEDFKSRGIVALGNVSRVLRLGPALEAVRDAAEKSVRASEQAVSRIDAFSAEFHEAGRHLKNMGRSIQGKPMEAEAKENGRIAGAFKSVLKKEQALLSAVSRGAEHSMEILAGLGQAAERRPSVLKAMKEQAGKTGPGKAEPALLPDKGRRGAAEL